MASNLKAMAFILIAMASNLSVNHAVHDLAFGTRVGQESGTATCGQLKGSH